MFAGYMKLLTVKETQSQAWHSNTLFVLGVFTKQQAHSTTLCLSHMLLLPKSPADHLSAPPVITYSKLSQIEGLKPLGKWNPLS